MRLTLQRAVEQYQLSVFRAAFYICKNRQDAEDAAQETFLAYYRSGEDFESAEHLRAWLLRTAIHKAQDMCRSFWRRNRESLDDYAETLSTAPGEDSEVLQAVLTLPERCRVIIYLFYYEGYSVHEVAQVLKLKDSTVKAQLHRGRLLLRERLKEEWNDDEC